MRPEIGLDALNFALAGAREGFGPFLGVYLQSRGFDPAVTGFVMGLAGLAGLIATTPIGDLVDRTQAKRAAVAAAVIAIALGAAAIVLTDNVWVMGAAQLVIGVADTSIAPLVAALTLGIVGAKVYGERVARNEAFNHAGNAANAALAAAFGYWLGLAYVALAIAVKSAASALVVFGIGKNERGEDAINHEAASGGGKRDERSTLRVLFESRPLLLLAVTTLAFQTANGAMLPFLAQARTAAGSNPSLTTGVMTVTAQVAMVAASFLAARIARARSQAEVMTVALVVTVVRGVLAAFATSWWLVVPIQVLEGLAMGLAGVAMPALAAEIMSGTGRANAGLGGVMTAFGAGATLSPLLAGFVAQHFGFPASFVSLAVVAGVGLVVWTVVRRAMGIVVCATPEERAGHDAEDEVAREAEKTEGRAPEPAG